MSSVGFLQPVYTQTNEYINEVCSTPLGAQVALEVSGLARRISEVALVIWKHINSIRQYIDDTFQYYQKGISLFIRSNMSSIIARFVLYSLNELTGEEYQARANEELTALRDTGSDAKAISFKTTEHATLSITTLLHPLDKNPKNKTIVYFPSNFEIWQMSIVFLKNLHIDAQVNVHAINYRGTGGSDGFPEIEDTLINDGHAYVQGLIDKGVQPNQIALFGGDIGAAVAACIASRLSLQNYDVHLVSIRSFRSLTEMIRNAFPLAPDFIAKLAANMKWKLNVEALLPTLRGRVICMQTPLDPLIVKEASFKAGLQEAKFGPLACQSIEYIEMNEEKFANESPELAEDPDCNPHIRPFASSEHKELILAIGRLWPEQNEPIVQILTTESEKN